MNPIIEDFKKKCTDSINRLKEDLKSIRTGRSNPAVLEDLIVEAYGGESKLKLQELATITTEGPSQLVVLAYDPLTIQDIEKSILKSPLGLSPITQGTRIIIRIPPLSEEQRTKLTKIINQKVEEVRVIIRNHRDEARKKVKHQAENEEITKDDRFKIEKDIDSATTKVNEELKVIKDRKDAEIMEV